MRFEIALARLALGWESFWRAAWPLACVAGLFGTLAVLDALPSLPPRLHALALLAFFVAFAVLGWRGLRRFKWPGVPEALRRLERDSGLDHRPLATLDDRPASTDEDGLALWAEHRRRAAARIASLKVALPSPGVPAEDPYALRAAVLLLMVVVAVGEWRDPWAIRFARAVTPPLAGVAASDSSLQVWITPPGHTGLAPILLRAPGEPLANPPTVPAGSALLAVLEGSATPAQLVVGDQRQPFVRLAEGTQRVETAIDDGASLAVRQGMRTIGEWPIRVVKDALPSVAFTDPPEADERGRLRLRLQASDDWGVAKAWVELRRADRPDEPGPQAEMPLPGGRNTETKLAGWHDLTGHVWAGLPVTLQPMALDGAGQTGAGEPLDMVLPERRFEHPVARALVALRRALAEDPLAARETVMAGLDRLSMAPDAFAGDLVVFLAMRASRARLSYGGADDEVVASVQDMLWKTALRIEEGLLPETQRRVAELARELENALAENADPAQIEHLMNQLQEAMRQMMQAMAEQAQRMGADQTPMASPDMETVTQQELEAMLEQMREMARTGSTEAARELLSQLQKMLEGMQPMTAGGEGAQEMKKAMDALDGLTRQQRELMDQTFQQSQQGGGQPQDSTAKADRQEELRRGLGEAMRQMGEALGDIPGPLGEAEQEMRGATQGLMAHDPAAAAQAQGQALQKLKDGMQQAMEQAQRQMGPGMARGGMPGGQGRDPLGRRTGPGQIDDQTVEVPTEAELHRARRILDELRRRSGEYGRPSEERDYLRRLLERF
ncbi:MAG: DUF4175 family protein [Alphaproteobacteria bacterium]|nr:DUF4175 family protein [Alphaproteobacteria bacterium]